MEKIFCNSPYTLSGWSLRKRIKFVTIIMLSFSLCEHLFSWYSFLNDRIIQANVCNWKIGSWFYYIATLHLSHIYKTFPVNVFTVIWAEYMNISFTFTWNFIDLFIMIMSLSIAIKFEMINERLQFFKGRVGILMIINILDLHYRFSVMTCRLFQINLGMKYDVITIKFVN